MLLTLDASSFENGYPHYKKDLACCAVGEDGAINNYALCILHTILKGTMSAHLFL
jgi:hypothetical protein